jgi:hypothetical protein
VEETGKSQTGLWKDGSVPGLQFQKLLERRIEEGMAAWRKAVSKRMSLVLPDVFRAQPVRWTLVQESELSSTARR